MFGTILRKKVSDDKLANVFINGLFSTIDNSSVTKYPERNSQKDTTDSRGTKDDIAGSLAKDSFSKEKSIKRKKTVGAHLQVPTTNSDAIEIDE